MLYNLINWISLTMIIEKQTLDFTCLDSSRRWAMIFLTFVTGLSVNPSPRVPTTTAVFWPLAAEALFKSIDLIEPNKPEPWVID